jgi:tetratricopeptide (TPR) repeat protein
VYGEAVVRDYLTVAMVHPDWKSVLDRWGIQSVLTAVTSPLTQALESSRDWRLVFVDHEAIVFVRDVPENRALFDRVGRVARATPRSVVRAALNAGMRAAERGEDETAIRRFQEVLAADAGNPVALYSLGLLLDRRGERVEAERLWRELRRLAPDSQLAAMAENELKKPRTRSIR